LLIALSICNLGSKHLLLPIGWRKQFCIKPRPENKQTLPTIADASLRQSLAAGVDDGPAPD